MIKIILIFASFSLCFSGFSATNNNSNSFSKIPENYLNRVVAAIYKIENSKKFPYGIKSLPIKGNNQREREEYARRICSNTVSNNYLRWQKVGAKGDYLDYLADVYCPPSCDKQGNLNWKKNIHLLVNKQKK